MAVAFETSSNTTYGTRTNTTVTAPTGIANDDLLLAMINMGNGAGEALDPTPPAGFVAVAGITQPQDMTDGGFNMESRLLYKIASGEAGDYTFTHASSTSQALMLRISGADTVDPFHPDPTSNPETPANTTATATGLTVSVDQTLIVWIGWDWGSTANNLSVPAGTTPTFTERIDVAPIIYVATGVFSGTGSTGNKSHTCNSTSGQPRGSYLVAVQPPTAPWEPEEDSAATLHSPRSTTRLT